MLNNLIDTLRFVYVIDLLDEFVKEVGLGSKGNGSSYDEIGLVLERLTEFKAVFEFNVLVLD